VLRCTMRLTIGAHINEETPKEVSDAITALEDDIIAAMYLDGQRGLNGTTPNAIDTIWNSSVDDIADAAAPDSRGGYGSLVMMFEISFLRLRGASPV